MTTYDPEAEAIGQYMVGFVEAAGEVSPVFERKARRLFERHLGDLDPDEWYPLKDCVTVFEEVLNEVGPKTMEEGGIAAADVLPLEDDLSLEEALVGLNDLQTGPTYRNTEMDAPAGEYLFDLDEARAGRVAVSEAWPLTEPYAKGVYRGVIDRWGPTDAMANFEKVMPEGDEQFAWRVQW
jgi:hypothetical protein